MAETGPETEIVLAGQVCIDRNDIDGMQYTDWGSAVLYMADYFKRSYDINPAVLSSHGPDFTGYADGFNIYPESPNTTQSLVYENVVRNEVRKQRCYNANGEVLPPVDQTTKQVLNNADLFFLAPLTPAYHPDYVEELLTDVPNDRLKILLPQGYMREISEDGSVSSRSFIEEPEIVPKFDLLIFSDDDIPDATGLAREWKQKNPKTKIVITQGPNGASVIEKDGATQVPTTAIPKGSNADTVGCGDTFSAAAAYYFLQDPSDLLSAVQKANNTVGQKLSAMST